MGVGAGRNLVLCVLFFIGLTSSPPAGKAADPATVSATALPPLTFYDANPLFLDKTLSYLVHPKLISSYKQQGIAAPQNDTVHKALGGYLSALPQKSQAPRRGVIADGVSKLIVRAIVPGPGRADCKVTNIDGRLQGERNGTCHLFFPEKPVLALEGEDKPHFVFAIYQPPNEFGQRTASDEKRFVDNIGQRGVKITIKWRPSNKEEAGAPAQLSSILVLERPPLVLVHGTYDNPTECWDWGKNDDSWLKASPDYTKYDDNFATRLRKKGFRVFLVNFKRSNGIDKFVTTRVTGSAMGVPVTTTQTKRISSHFRDNQEIAWTGARPPFDPPKGEGIKAALEQLRKDGIAATQADMIGHSMGGVLIRAYARGTPLPRGTGEICQAPATSVDSKNWYYREDNFGEGDINRIITIGSTHKGSHISGFLDEHRSYFSTVENFSVQERANNALNNLLTEVTPQSSLAERLYGDLFVFGAAWDTKKLSKGAFTDQIPMSAALSCMGPTPVPSHAVAGVATIPDLDLFAGTSEGPGGVYRERMEKIWNSTTDYMIGIADELPLSGVLYDIFLNKFQKPETYARLKEAIDSLEGAIDNRASITREISALQLGIANAQIVGNTSLMARNRDLIQQYESQTDALNKAVEQARDYAMQIFMFAVFGNDYTDFVVSLDSQLGGLENEPRYHTILPKRFGRPGQDISKGHGILHGYEPRHYLIQDRVIELLEGGMENFRQEGFPASSLPKFYSPNSSPVRLPKP